MAEQPLPNPATQADTYMHEIAMQLRKLNSVMADNGRQLQRIIDLFQTPQAAPETDEVELREPEPPKKPAHRDALKAAAKLAPDAVGPVTVETVDIVEPNKPVGPDRKS